MTSRHFWIDDWVANAGVKFMAAEIHGVQVRKKNLDLEKSKKETVARVIHVDTRSHPVLQGYRDIFAALNIGDAVASPEWLHQIIAQRGQLPQINTIVDAYNEVSLKSCVVVSAHDLAQVAGDVRIERTRGGEPFFPLGKKEVEALPAEEWAGKCDNHILCRLNCKQSALSMVTLQTTDLLVYVQGNRVTTAEYLKQTLIEVCEHIIVFNGGTYRLLPERRKDH